MRDYRFRIWNPATETMTYNVGLDRISEYADETLVKMQQTGLKDKRGTNIYDGDILHVSSELLTNFGRTRTGVMSNSYYQVKWVVDGWGYIVLKSDSLVVSDKDMPGIEVASKYGVVFGNEYETPELLKQE